TLLDVQLDIGRDGAWSMACLGDAPRIAANAADLLGEHHAVAPGPVDFLLWQVTNEAAAAREAALFIAPDHYVQRMTIAVAALGDVGAAERHAAHTALRIRAELGEVGEMLVHARTVHAPALPVALLGKRSESHHRLNEVAAPHFTEPCR